MAKLTTDQIEFAKAMTIKQRGVLNALSMFDCYMSASEMADEDLHADLSATGFLDITHNPVLRGVPTWVATDAGRAISQRIKKGAL